MLEGEEQVAVGMIYTTINFGMIFYAFWRVVVCCHHVQMMNIGPVISMDANNSRLQYYDQLH